MKPQTSEARLQIGTMKQGRRPRVRELPTIFYQDGKKYQIQCRGQRCFTVRAVDEAHWQYRVLERVVHDSPLGFIEVLKDSQKFQRFLTMEDCEKHFYKVENNGTPLMLPLTGK